MTIMFLRADSVKINVLSSEKKIDIPNHIHEFVICFPSKKRSLLEILTHF